MSPEEPGKVFKPGDTATQPAELPPVQATPSTSQIEAPKQQTASEVPPQEAASTYALTPPVSNPATPQSTPVGASFSEGEVTWTASEYLANPKSAGWFSLLMLASIALAVVVYVVTKDIISTVVIGMLGLIVGIFAARQPRVLDYRIDNQGLYIGQRFYPYASFKSFSIVQDHALGYISLLPLKRFMPPLTVHYDPADEDRIAQTLADYLPYEDHKPDIVDNFTRRIRF